MFISLRYLSDAEYKFIYYRRKYMDVRNCRGCGKLFNYVAGPIMCPSCREALEAKFQEVKTYIQDNRGVTVQQVSEACDIDGGQIRHGQQPEQCL